MQSSFPHPPKLTFMLNPCRAACNFFMSKKIIKVFAQATQGRMLQGVDAEVQSRCAAVDARVQLHRVWVQGCICTGCGCRGATAGVVGAGVLLHGAWVQGCGCRGADAGVVGAGVLLHGV